MLWQIRHSSNVSKNLIGYLDWVIQIEGTGISRTIGTRPDVTGVRVKEHFEKWYNSARGFYGLRVHAYWLSRTWWPESWSHRKDWLRIEISSFYGQIISARDSHGREERADEEHAEGVAEREGIVERAHIPNDIQMQGSVKNRTEMSC